MCIRQLCSPRSNTQTHTHTHTHRRHTHRHTHTHAHTFNGVMRHPKFMANTVKLAVATRSEDALSALSKITRGLRNNGVFSTISSKRRFTKPTEQRRQQEVCGFNCLFAVFCSINPVTSASSLLFCMPLVNCRMLLAFVSSSAGSRKSSTFTLKSTLRSVAHSLASDWPRFPRRCTLPPFLLLAFSFVLLVFFSPLLCVFCFFVLLFVPCLYLSFPPYLLAQSL